MKTIPVNRTAMPDGDLLSPAEPFPANAIAIVCDGSVYTIYEPGDLIPPTENLGSE